MPGYRAAGWPLRRVLTDNGKEFKASVVTTCAARQVRHTRTKPRHAWTNGFVERLQGTILHEHWRIEFRRPSFTSAWALQRSLDQFLVFYNRHRPHRGYRLRGRTPATVFRGAVAASREHHVVERTVNTFTELDRLVLPCQIVKPQHTTHRSENRRGSVARTAITRGKMRRRRTSAVVTDHRGPRGQGPKADCSTLPTRFSERCVVCPHA